MKKRHFIILILAVVLVGIAVISVCLSADPNLNASKADAFISEQSEYVNHIANADGSLDLANIDGEVFRLVNGENVINSDMIFHRRFDLDAVVDYYIDQELLVREAEKQGIRVSDEELTEYIETQRGYIHEEESAAEYKERMNSLYCQLGLTEDEYWAAFAENYRREILVSKYVNQLYNEFMRQKVEERSKTLGDNLTDSELDDISEREVHIYNDEVSEAFSKYIEEYKKSLREENSVQSLIHHEVK